jgi:hypothetical protein
MIAAPISTDDERRPQPPREMPILDASPDERFDRVVKLAAHEFDGPSCWSASFRKARKQ